MHNYETDYAGWAKEQAALLRSGQFAQIDIDHIAKELESIMGNERREIYHRMIILIAHLLKWQLQPDHRSNSWRSTIRIQRSDILNVLKDSPSLKRTIPEQIQDAYPDAKDLAAYETGLINKDLPKLCPYSEDEVLNPDFWPD